MGFQQLQRTYNGSKHSAPINIGDQNHRRIGPACQIHVDDIPVLQIDLGRTARSFHQHNIIGIP
ncbi:hypothetical protein D3C76_1395860 [compost metagenome]